MFFCDLLAWLAVQHWEPDFFHLQLTTPQVWLECVCGIRRVVVGMGLKLILVRNVPAQPRNTHTTVRRHKSRRNMTFMSCVGGTWPGRRACNSLFKSNQTQHPRFRRVEIFFFKIMTCYVLFIFVPPCPPGFFSLIHSKLEPDIKKYSPPTFPCLVLSFLLPNLSYKTPCMALIYWLVFKFVMVQRTVMLPWVLIVFVWLFSHFFFW